MFWLLFLFLGGNEEKSIQVLCSFRGINIQDLCFNIEKHSNFMEIFLKNIQILCNSNF